MRKVTRRLKEMDNGDIMSVLPVLGNLVGEVEWSEIGEETSLEIVDGLAQGQSQEREDQNCFLHTCIFIINYSK